MGNGKHVQNTFYGVLQEPIKMRQKGSRQPSQIGILLKNGNWRDLFMLEANVQQSRILGQKIDCQKVMSARKMGGE